MARAAMAIDDGIVVYRVPPKCGPTQARVQSSVRTAATMVNATLRGALPGPGVDGAGVCAGRRQIGSGTMPAAASAGIRTGRKCVSFGSGELNPVATWVLTTRVSQEATNNVTAI